MRPSTSRPSRTPRRIAAAALTALGALGLAGPALGTIAVGSPSLASWVPVTPANAPQFDFVADQQTGALSGDVVGNGTHRAFFVQFDGTSLAFRVRLNQQDSNNATLRFNNFGFVGLDANRDGGIDLFLGVYNPTGNNGRVAIYGSDPGATNLGPSSTGIDGATVFEQAPTAGTNYSILATGDGSTFGGDGDYFVTWLLPFAQIQSALAARGITGVTAASPLRYIMGTAQQDNSFNVDIAGLQGISAQDVRSWQELGAFSPYVNASGTVDPTLTAPINYLDPTVSTALNTPLTYTSSPSSQGISVVDTDTSSLTVTLTATDGTLTLSGTIGLAFGTGSGTGDATMSFSGTQGAINAGLNGAAFTPSNAFTGVATVTISTTDGSATDTDIQYVRVGLAPDSTAPTLQSSSPADNAVSVPLASNVDLTFSEAVVPGTSGAVVLRAANGTAVETFNVATGQGDHGGTIAFAGPTPGATVVLNPGQDLANGSNYHVTIVPGAITDVAGNAFAGIASATTLNFSTGAGGGDTTPPTLQSTSPADNATGVSTTTTVALTFDEPVQPGIGLVTLVRTGTGTVETFDVATGLGSAGGSIAFGGSTVTLDPAMPLLAGTGYHVTVGGTAITDAASNAFAGIANATTVNFTTAPDATAPTLVSSSPADDATNVPVVASLTLTFSEPVQPGTGVVSLVRTGTGTVETFDVATGIGSLGGQLTFSGASIAIDPTQDLLHGSGYHVLVDTTAVRDGAGNAFAGIASSTTVSFTTAPPPDVTPPTLVSSSPADDASAVAVSSPIVLTFDEPLQAGTGTISVHTGSGAVETFDVATGLGDRGGTLVVTGATVTLDPGQDLAPGTGYHVVVQPGALRDAAGNAYAGIVDATTLTFTTNAPPAVPPAAAEIGASPSGATFDVLVGATDPEGRPLTVVGFTDGEHGTVSCDGVGRCTYTPARGFVGRDTFTVTISDGDGGTTVRTITVIVAGADTGTTAGGLPETFLIRIHYRIRERRLAALCAKGCTATVVVRTRAGRRVYAVDAAVQLGRRTGIEIRPGSRVRIDMPINVKRFLGAARRDGAMFSAETRTTVTLARGGRAIATLRDGHIRVSDARIRAGLPPGKKGLGAL